MLSRRLLRIKVIKALYSHFKSDSDSMVSSEKNLMVSVDKTYDLYHLLLWIVVDVARFAEHRMELARQKKLPTEEDLNPNTKFVDNAVIRQIENSKRLGDYLQKKGLSWGNFPELIKNLYVSLAAEDYYRDYMNNPSRSYREDLKFVENFFINSISDNPLVEDAVEEQSILWGADDVDFALMTVTRTLGGFKASQSDIPLLPQFKSDDDREFVKELFRRTLAGYGEYISYIDKYTSNWDVERIAFMDNVIMATAIAEILSFPSIPVRVTLDEYIEIAKYYSTPGSSLFINGVLDRVVETLNEEGKIKKTGRGLL